MIILIRQIHRKIHVRTIKESDNEVMCVVNGHPDNFITSPWAKCTHKHDTGYACGWKLTHSKIYVFHFYGASYQDTIKWLFLEIVFNNMFIVTNM